MDADGHTGGMSANPSMIRIGHQPTLPLWLRVRRVSVRFVRRHGMRYVAALGLVAWGWWWLYQDQPALFVVGLVMAWWVCSPRRAAND